MTKFDILILFTGVVFYNIIPADAVDTHELNLHYKSERNSLNEVIELNNELVQVISLELNGVYQVKDRCKAFVTSVENADVKSEEILKLKDELKNKSQSLEQSNEVSRKLKELEAKLIDDVAFFETLKAELGDDGTDVVQDYNTHEPKVHEKLLAQIALAKELSLLEHDKLFVTFQEVARILETASNKLDVLNDNNDPAGSYTDLSPKYTELLDKIKSNGSYIFTWARLVNFYQNLVKKIYNNSDNIAYTLSRKHEAKEVMEEVMHANEYVLYADKNVNTTLANVSGKLSWAQYLNDFWLADPNQLRKVNRTKYFDLKNAITKCSAMFQDALDALHELEVHKYTRIAIGNLIKIYSFRAELYSKIDKKFGLVEQEEETVVENECKLVKRVASPKKSDNWKLYLIIFGAGLGIVLFLVCATYIVYYVRKRRLENQTATLIV